MAHVDDFFTFTFAKRIALNSGTFTTSWLEANFKLSILQEMAIKDSKTCYSIKNTISNSG